MEDTALHAAPRWVERQLTMRRPSIRRAADGYAVPDGLAEIEREMASVMNLIARTARWVHPEIFNELPIWCPDTARGRPRWNATWTEVQRDGRGREKVEENIRAGNAFMKALGVIGGKPPNWTCCHIWGYDDPKFAGRSSVVQDPRYYSCVGNIVWLPTPLKGFTDAVPWIKECLRVCAFHLYGFVCEVEEVRNQADRIRAGHVPEGYPTSWPTPDRHILPPGTAPESAVARLNASKQKDRIRNQLVDPSLIHYGHDDVRRVLRFWNVDLA